MSNQNEVTYETGMDEQFKQSANNANSDSINGHDKREDSDRCYIELLRSQESQRHNQQLSFTQDKHDQAMREAKQHAERMDQLRINPSEAKSISEVLSGVQIEAIRTIVVASIKELGLK
jgi:hypothetical protein